MNRRYSFSTSLFILAAAGVLLGCSLTGRAGELVQQVPTDQPQPVQIGTQPPVSEPTSTPESGPAGRGPGAFDLTQPAVGLDQLPGYASHLVMTFKGSLTGQPYETSTATTRSLTVQPAGFISEMDHSATGVKPFYILAGQIGDQQVAKPSREANCQTTVDPTLTDTGEIPDPAVQLLPILGAEPAGEETVGQVDALHYKFDERALGLSKGTAAGEVWVARDGGWVVKYALRIQAPEGVLGAGLEGEQTWEYEAAPIQAVELPEGCSPALDGYPQLSDAQDVVRMNGAISYTSAAGLDEAVQFYTDEMAAAGWEAQEAFPPGAERAVLLFAKPGEQDQQVAAITLQVKAALLWVDIQEVTTPLPPTPAPGQGVPQMPDLSQIPGMPTIAP